MSDKVGSNNKVIGLVSGNGVGKTTLSECLLFNSKATESLGKVEEKNTVSDFSPMEEGKGFSISSSIMHYKWKDFNINLIDSPGYSDFAGQSQSTLKVSDSVIMIVDAKSGVQAPTEIILEMLAENPKPMFVVLNKMDLENIDFFKAVDGIKSTKGLNLVPITIPVDSGENFSQVIDILQNKAYQYKDGTPTGTVTDIDAGVKDQIGTYHGALVESIVETNDELLDKYLEGEKIDNSILSNVFKKAVVSGEVVPVFAISAAKNFGIDLLMDYINSLLPSSLDIPPIKAKTLGKEEETDIEPSSDSTALAYVFKTMADPYIGKLSIFRIFSGTFKAGESYRISSEDKPFKFGNLFKLQGKKQIEISEATCGDIIAVSKLMKISNDDTISSIDKPLIMDKVEYLQPTLPRAIIPKNKGDEEKIGNGISKLIEEDQTLRQELDIEVHQNIIWGMGDLHLNITRDQLKEKYDVEVDMIKPDVAYKETIKKEAKTEYKYKKQSGGRGQYGHVFIELKPRKRGEGFEFTDSIFGGSIPKGYIPGVEKGIREALDKGILAKNPVVDIGVNLYDGSFHNVDSSEMAFKIAASMAFKKGMEIASPVILEPIMELDIIIPEKYMGDIIGDINSKRGKIISMTPIENKKQLIKASAPQSEAFNYAVDLTSLTQGRGRFSQKLLKYEELPYNLTEKLIEERKTQEE
ncbi:MAG: elongation factor G [Actinobacteria bacterium]|nr:elongation factor G [Actinomycetota bacterium]